MSDSLENLKAALKELPRENLQALLAEVTASGRGAVYRKHNIHRTTCSHDFSKPYTLTKLETDYQAISMVKIFLRSHQFSLFTRPII